MATLELSINTNYVPGWGAWEAVRELLQNAKDADDLGAGMTVRFTKGGQLIIENQQGTLTRDSLLLGSTTKANRADQRGQFGEGYKLALLVLCRLGHDVVIHAGAETWTPFIETSERFDGAEVLKIRTRPRQGSTQSGVKFVVKGLGEDEWRAVQANTLFLQPALGDEAVETCHGTVLTDEAYAGKLYVGGLFVCKMPDNYRYGYDLKRVSLDRDRKLAEPWSLRWEISKTLGVAVEANKLEVVPLLDPFRGEAKALAANLEYVRSIAQETAAAFLAEHGDTAMPVDDYNQAQEAEHHGFKPVMMGREQRALIEAVTGPAESRIQQRNLEAREVVQLGDMTLLERENLDWALQLVNGAVGDLKQSVQVVEFYGERVKGTFTPDTIRLARRLLTDKSALISTLVHEVAHNEGGDGDHAHAAAMQRLFADIIVFQVGDGA